MGINTRAVFITALFILALGSLFSCGGGGDSLSSAINTGGGSDAVLTMSDAEEIGGMLMQAASLYEPINVAGLPEPPDSLFTLSVKESRSPLLGLFGVVQTAMKPVEAKTPSVIPHKESCSDGGSIDMDVTPRYEKFSIDPTGYNADITFNSCKIGTGELGGKMRVILDGSPNNPSVLTATTNGVFYKDSVEKHDLQLGNVAMVFNEFTTYQGKKIPQAVKVTGVLAGTLFGENLNLACENFVIKHYPDPSGNGASISLAGRVKPLCVNGWVTVETPTLVYIPTGSDCPVNGTILVKAGSNTIAVSFAQNSSVTSQFNNTVVKSYTNCKGITGLCKG